MHIEVENVNNFQFKFQYHLMQEKNESAVDGKKRRIECTQIQLRVGIQRIDEKI